MKKLIILTAMLCMICISANSQSKTTANTNGQKVKAMSQAQKDTLLFAYLDAYLSQLREPQYKLYSTENMWTFLKLDTQSGKIWQVQYSVGNDYRGEIDLNVNSLVTGDSLKNGRFTLYPTKNLSNFVLLD